MGRFRWYHVVFPPTYITHLIKKDAKRREKAAEILVPKVDKVIDFVADNSTILTIAVEVAFDAAEAMSLATGVGVGFIPMLETSKRSLEAGIQATAQAKKLKDDVKVLAKAIKEKKKASEIIKDSIKLSLDIAANMTPGPDKDKVLDYINKAGKAAQAIDNSIENVKIAKKLLKDVKKNVEKKEHDKAIKNVVKITKEVDKIKKNIEGISKDDKDKTKEVKPKKKRGRPPGAKNIKKSKTTKDPSPKKKKRKPSAYNLFVKKHKGKSLKEIAKLWKEERPLN